MDFGQAPPSKISPGALQPCPSKTSRETAAPQTFLMQTDKELVLLHMPVQDVPDQHLAYLDVRHPQSIIDHPLLSP
jgi:hypothetical protein